MNPQKRKNAVTAYNPEPPPKKEINELLGQEPTESIAHQNMRSYNDGKIGQTYQPYDRDDCTRPDIYKDEDDDGDEY